MTLASEESGLPFLPILVSEANELLFHGAVLLVEFVQ
jgi:hypothetical protein